MPTKNKATGTESMKAQFMKAARNVGKFLGLAALSFSLIACGGEAEANSSPSVKAPTAQTVQQDPLPFPMLPASFKDATHQGQKGCIADDQNVGYVLGGIARNEGMDYIGAHPQVQIPQDGVFIMDVLYSKAKGYGYILENRGQGKRCINQVITDLKTHEELNLIQTQPVHHQESLKPEDCTFAPQVINLCGTFEQISGRLSAAGYSKDWQAKNEDGHTMTMMSGTGQSWILTTHKDTGATIFTGAGKGEFVFPQATPPATPPNLVAKN